MRLTSYAAAPVALLVLAACGTETQTLGPRAEESVPATMPRAVPVPDGPVITRYAATVLDDGDGAELCLGGVATSFPPQCGGPKLVGWDWSEAPGSFEDVRGVKWGDFAVTGTFDGHDLVVDDVVPADELDPPERDDERDFTTPCAQPDGGWPVPAAADNTIGGTDRAFRRAQQLADYAGSWVDTSREKRTPEQMDQDALRGDDAVSSWIINVQVTDDVGAAEAAIREVWSGALCVTRARHTERELRQIHEAVRELPGVLSSGHGFDTVDVDVVYDDGTLQAWVDQEHGAGVVRLTSALVSAG